ncbi:tRNA-specific adenosine deaminase 1 [Portunus trituberculatus]|uniref:tRNA-specific adenosine deaminase 1 n=1 Tax=Portunus trituberculatus TaxID=210409 RepID=A0A5B7F806_PORTR|nr:tRNA-specific adenosine deaminase 1 [Portunus trituberculatus]
MEMCTEEFANKIVQLCISKYNSLKKTGKPKNEAEWTLLSCFVQENQCSHKLKVVALGTGSKCIGSHQLPSTGDILHDSHAEVVARRAFVLYLITQVRKATEGHNSIFEIKDGAYYLKSGIRFHFYTSHTPCGDASIFLKQEWLECVGNILETKEGPTTSLSSLIGDSDLEPPIKKRRCQGSSDFEDQIALQDTKNAHVKFDNMRKMDDLEKEKNITECIDEVSEVLSDTFRTGAKCVAGEAPDPKLPGSKYHVTGVLRTKPGRGDPTLSLSCSDKIFRWTILGVQGALLMILLKKPVYITTIVIGQCPYSQEAMKRAIYGRFEDGLNNLNLPEEFSVQTPVLVQSSIDFAHSRINIAKTSSEGIGIFTSIATGLFKTSASKQQLYIFNARVPQQGPAAILKGH